MLFVAACPPDELFRKVAEDYNSVAFQFMTGEVVFSFVDCLGIWIKNVDLRKTRRKVIFQETLMMVSSSLLVFLLACLTSMTVLSMSGIHQSDLIRSGRFSLCFCESSPE